MRVPQGFVNHSFRHLRGSGLAAPAGGWTERSGGPLGQGVAGLLAGVSRAAAG